MNGALGCAEFPALLQVSGVSLDKQSKIALFLTGSSEVMLFFIGEKKVRAK